MQFCFSTETYWVGDVDTFPTTKKDTVGRLQAQSADAKTLGLLEPVI